VSAGRRHVGTASPNVSIIASDGAIGSSVQLPLAYTRGSDWVREAKKFRALSVSAGRRHVGSASPNISIIASDGGYRF